MMEETGLMLSLAEVDPSTGLIDTAVVAVIGVSI